MYNEEELKQCLECRWRKRQVKFHLGLLAFLVALSMLFALIVFVVEATKYEDIGVVAAISFLTALGFDGVVLCVLLPFIIYELHEYKKILRFSSHAVLYKVFLNQPNVSFNYRSCVYYTVSFNTEDRKHISANTRPMWSSYAFLSFPLDEYNNKEVEILYNQIEDKVIVLGLKNWHKEKIKN
ncbi:MAG: hypothetical protein K2K48_07225 [Anaeroplasmataceae bacterium]|nr:hypothetical protein [Anaeroplasmataceae bacterium]MDE6415192.1 hypothetical protein [Anaeroplasmataceae bacterium]